MKPVIAIINATTVLHDADFPPVVAALQKQISGDFAPFWGKDASLVFVPKGQKPPSGSWWMVHSDTSDEAGALGYHDTTAQGLPIGKVFVKTTQSDGGIWTVTTSHELLEMLGDPDIVRTVFIQKSDTVGTLYAYEACDAVEADNLGYKIDNVQVSDFVTQEWFDPGRIGVPFSFKRHVTAPLQLAPGGYIGIFRVGHGNGWTQITHASHPMKYMDRAKLGSRREKRSLPIDHRINSTIHSE